VTTAIDGGHVHSHQMPQARYAERNRHQLEIDRIVRLLAPRAAEAL